MDADRTPDSPNAPQIVAALQQWSADQQASINQLVQLAESGDEVARAVAAYMLGPQAGRWADGLPHAKAAIENGITFLGYIYGQNLIGIGDAALRPAVPDLMRAALEDGWPVDPFNAAVQASQQGDTQTAQALVNLAAEPQPAGARKRWDDLIAEVSARRDDVTSAAVAAARSANASSRR